MLDISDDEKVIAVNLHHVRENDFQDERRAHDEHCPAGVDGLLKHKMLAAEPLNQLRGCICKKVPGVDYAP